MLLGKNKRTTEAIEINLQLCLPELTKDQREAFKKKRLTRMCQTLFEMSHIWIKPVEQIRSYLVATYDNSLFESAVDNEDGIIVLAPHIGNWEMMAVYLSQFRTLTTMYKPLKEPGLNRFIRAARERFNSVLVPTNSKGVRQIIRVLKSQGMVGFLPDQVPEKNVGGVFAPLFGHQAYTMTLAHKLALKTKSKVFIGTAYQVKKGFAVRMIPIDSGFYSQNPLKAAICLNEAIEKAILYQPIQNQWEYKRYRLQPEGNKSLYK
jgi:KDO2-lipid IV(A) lauroyltransferase